MCLTALHLQNFRNRKELSLHFHENAVYLSGPNGAGKTSAIEAAYLLLTLKTFRKNALSDITSFGEPFFRVAADFSGDAGMENAVFFYREGRTVLVNGAEASDLSRYTYTFPVVCYSPGFETFLSAEHSVRRLFLDRMIFYTDPDHLSAVRGYNLLLARKRAELAKENPDRQLLGILHEQMEPFSVKISSARLRLIEELNRSVMADPLYPSLMDGLALALSVSGANGEGMESEIQASRPLYGCHKDLLYMKQGKKVVEKFQSFGQKKSCLLLMLFHMAKRIEQSRKSGIIFLLDDFEAGLDNQRIHLLSQLFLHTDPFKRQILFTGVSEAGVKGAAVFKLQ